MTNKKPIKLEVVVVCGTCKPPGSGKHKWVSRINKDGTEGLFEGKCIVCYGIGKITKTIEVLEYREVDD